MALLLLPALLAAPAGAMAPPDPLSCTPATEGALACLAGRLCLCRFEPGGSMAGRPAGHRWDCGPLRPDCAPPPQGLAPLPALPLPEPLLLLPAPPPLPPPPRSR